MTHALDVQVVEQLAQSFYKIVDLGFRSALDNDLKSIASLLPIFLVTARRRVWGTGSQLSLVPISNKSLKDLSRLSPSLEFLGGPLTSAGFEAITQWDAIRIRLPEILQMVWGHTVEDCTGEKCAYQDYLEWVSLCNLKTSSSLTEYVPSALRVTPAVGKEQVLLQRQNRVHYLEILC